MADDTDDTGPSLSSLKAQLKSATARITELNEEAKGHRLNANEARTELERLRGEMTLAMKEAGEKSVAAEKATKEAGERVTQALRDAALKVAARDAGIHDLDALKLLDTSAVKVGEDGTVTIPDKFFDEAKTAKPYLFKLTGTDTGDTSSKAKPPGESKTTTKKVGDMAPAERQAAYAALGIRL